jgi:mannose-6-phosphate isomerase-like protein (cupin superfamily)
MPHLGVVLSGRMHFEMDDGTGCDIGPGDVYSIPPGHDAWVVGDEPVRSLDIAPHGDAATERAIEAGTEGSAG